MFAAALKLIFWKADLASFSGVELSAKNPASFSGVELARPVYQTQKYILASFSRVAKAKAKAYFFWKADLASFSGVAAKAEAKLIFFEKQIWFWYKESGFLFQCRAQCKESGFLFLAFCSLALFSDSKAEIEKTVGICSSAQAYFFWKADLASFFGVKLSAKNLASFSGVVLVHPVKLHLNRAAIHGKIMSPPCYLLLCFNLLCFQSI